MKWHSEVLIPFITLRCNFKCRYCITRFSPDFDFSYKELPGEKWVEFINAQENVKDVIFNGGEPTLHQDFSSMINNLREFRLIAIGTNYSSMATRALLKLTPREYIIIDGTFHPHFISHHDISQNLLRLQAAGFRVRVHVLDYPGFTGRPPSFVHDFKLQGIVSFTQRYEGFYEDRFYYDQKKLPYCGLSSKSTCLCSRSIYTPVAPNGEIFFCHYLMYAKIKAGVLGNISAPPSTLPEDLNCAYLGYCNPCDWPRAVSEVSNG